MTLLRFWFLKICKSAPSYDTLRKVKRLCFQRILICNQDSISEEWGWRTVFIRAYASMRL